MAGPLDGLRVFDLTRVLAGPSCTQILGDLGADVIKVERPGAGDDTRKFGPPFVTDGDGKETTESGYFLSANRNKRSITLDLTSPEGQDLARDLIATCDILVENFKFGNLEKYGLGYEQLHKDNPGLVYCSITGFGHSGPKAERPGYDFLIQGMGGFMSITGEPDGEPQKPASPSQTSWPVCGPLSRSTPPCATGKSPGKASTSISACSIPWPRPYRFRG